MRPREIHILLNIDVDKAQHSTLDDTNHAPRATGRALDMSLNFTPFTYLQSGLGVNVQAVSVAVRYRTNTGYCLDTGELRGARSVKGEV